MKKRHTNNLPLKIVSILIATLVWAVIANFNDPLVSKTYSVPVTIINGAYIESIGKTYRVLEEEQDKTVKVVLRGKSSVVENRPLSDIQAVADLTQIVDMNTEPYVAVPITITCENVLAENISVTPQNLKIVLEEVESEEFIITAEAKNQPNSDFRVGEVTAIPEKVKIMGPASVIQKIDHVLASVAVNGLDEDSIRSSRLIVYDKNQEPLSQTLMSYLKFDIGDPIVEVNVDLWRVVTDIEVQVEYQGEPGYGYQVSGLSSTPSRIGIAGTEEALEQLKASNNTIVISASKIDVSEMTSNVETKVDITEFLPEGTKMASEVNTAIVTVLIIPLGSKQFTIQTKNIGVIGLDERYTVTYETDEIVFGLKAAEKLLVTINEETFNAQIDLSNQGVGSHKVPVNITVPNDSEMLEEVVVGIEIKELE